MSPEQRGAADLKRRLTLFHNLLFAENAAYGLRRLGALRQPVLRPFRVDFDLRGIRYRVVLPEYFEESPVACSPLVDHHNPVKGTFLRPDTGQTHSYQTVCLLTYRETCR